MSEAKLPQSDVRQHANTKLNVVQPSCTIPRQAHGVSIDEYIYNTAIAMWILTRSKKSGGKAVLSASERANECASVVKQQQKKGADGNRKVPKSNRVAEKGKWDVDQTQDKPWKGGCSQGHPSTRSSALYTIPPRHTRIPIIVYKQTQYNKRHISKPILQYERWSSKLTKAA